jgi:hypothetical protein
VAVVRRLAAWVVAAAPYIPEVEVDTACVVAMRIHNLTLCRFALSVET